MLEYRRGLLAALCCRVLLTTACGPALEVTLGEATQVIQTANGQGLTHHQLDLFIADQMSQLGMPGLSIAIINDGRMVYHRSLGSAERGTNLKVNDQSIFEAASLSKPVFAYFVMQMVEQGLLELDAPLHTYLPFDELAADRRYQQVTARMVLSHTSGFPNWRWFDPAPAELGIARGTMYIKHPPGSYSYSGEAYHYLARVIAHLSGHDDTTLDQLIAAHVSTPLQIDSFYWTWDDSLETRKVAGHKQGQTDGREWPKSFPDDTQDVIGVAGRLHTEAAGYARFLMALMNSQGLTESSLDEMLSPQSRVPANSYGYTHNGIVAWGLGIAIEPTAYGTRYRHGGNNGGFQSAFMFYRQKQLGYVFLTNSDQGEAFNLALQQIMTEGLPEPSSNHSPDMSAFPQAVR